jgi:hypothetical protein
VVVGLLCLRRIRTIAKRRRMTGIPIPRPTPNPTLIVLFGLLPFFIFDEDVDVDVDVTEVVDWVVEVLTRVKGDKV